MYLRARTKEQFDERKKEILDAMDSLYLNKELSSIYLKDISEMTHISRTAIYFYYKSKEEILLDSFYNHFIKLDDALSILTTKTLPKEELIDYITSIFEENIIILKIMSSNLEDIERSTSLENLITLKKEFKRFQTIFKLLIKKINPSIDENIVLTTFITMMYGYYPISYPIDVQKEAMKKTNSELNISLKELIKSSLNILLK